MSAILHRPTAFSEVIGRQAIILPLREMVTTRKFPKVILFQGSKGSGKTTLARILSKAANCEMPSDGDCCNNCRYCLEPQDSLSDLLIEWDVPMNRKVEDAERLIQLSEYKVQPDKHRFFLLDEAHQFTDAAWEKLHKALEDPALTISHSYQHTFILCTTKVQSIPPPIVSRSMSFYFPPVETNLIYQHLQTLSTAPAEALELIAKVSNGDVRAALNELEKVELLLAREPKDWGTLLGLATTSQLKEVVAKLWNKNHAAIPLLSQIFTMGSPELILDQLYPYFLKAFQQAEADKDFWSTMILAIIQSKTAGPYAEGVFVSLTYGALAK